MNTYLASFKKAGIDTLILGCTHYPLLKPVIKEALGGKVTLIDSAKQAAIEVKKILASENMLNLSDAKGKSRFFVSDNPLWFEQLAKRFMGQSVKGVTKVDCNV